MDNIIIYIYDCIITFYNNRLGVVSYKTGFGMSINPKRQIHKIVLLSRVVD